MVSFAPMMKRVGRSAIRALPALEPPAIAQKPLNGCHAFGLFFRLSVIEYAPEEKPVRITVFGSVIVELRRICRA